MRTTAAASSEDLDVLRALVDAGADRNARDERGETERWLAAGPSESPEVVRMLFDAGDDPKATGLSGCRATNCARESDHLQGSAAYWQLDDARFN